MLHLFGFALLRSPLQSLKNAYQSFEITDPLLEAGIYLSSPEFWRECQKKENLSSEDKAKMNLTLAKYWLRSCVRPTPYGTLAGAALLKIDEKDTEIVINDKNEHRCQLRLDMNFVTNITQSLEELPNIQNQIKYFTSNSIYELSDSFRYIEYYIKDNQRNYKLNAVKKTHEITKILDFARKGASMDELVNFTLCLTDESKENIRIFILSLWQSQLLVSDLEPQVTGKDPLTRLIEKLEELKHTDELLNHLKDIKHLLDLPEKGVSHLVKIETKLKNIGIDTVMPKYVIQTDLFLSLNQNLLNKELLQNIVSQTEDLFLLSCLNSNQELQEFKVKFYKKYETREIPLALAIDSEHGIGYAGLTDNSISGADFVDNLAIAVNPIMESKTTIHIQDYVFSKYHDYLKNGKQYIEITKDELNRFADKTAKLKFPSSMSIMGSLLKKNELCTKEEFLFDLNGISGPTGGNLLGRFTHGDIEVYEFTKEILKAEEIERPDVIYAEIVHLPQARVGNVIIRPLLREYEIPYVGISGVAVENQILIDDLLISLRDGEIVLRSKKHNKRVIPRLTTAHNFAFKSLPVYKFLCDVQSQDFANPNIWDWGRLIGLSHLPRVIYKDLIIKKAQWIIEDKNLPKLLNERIDKLKKIRLEMNIPQRVLYLEGDNKLLIDFEEKMGIELVVHYLNRHKTILLQEFLFSDENCVVNDICGLPYTNEMIIPVYQKVSEIQSVLDKPLLNHALMQRKFSPYSEWLYFKIYAGPKAIERILKSIILDYIEVGLRQNTFESFFFVRYRDEFPHIRIRFFNSDVSKQLIVYSSFIQILRPILEEGSVDQIILDTYSREIERYGPDLIEESESLFFNDSLAVLRFINLLDGDEGEKYRLLFALRGIDMLLNNFKFSLEDKMKLVKNLQSSFFKEFGGQLVLQKQLNEKYRVYQKNIFSHMDRELDILNEIDEGISLFNIRSEMNSPIIDSILYKIATSNRQERLFELLPSYIHMFANRLFIGNHRKYELLIYHFLERYYTSQKAILRKTL